MSGSPDLKSLKRALHVLARVVALHGDAFLPIFKRLEEEVAKAEEQEATRRRALEMARGYERQTKKRKRLG